MVDGQRGVEAEHDDREEGNDGDASEFCRVGPIGTKNRRNRCIGTRVLGRFRGGRDGQSRGRWSV